MYRLSAWFTTYTRLCYQSLQLYEKCRPRAQYMYTAHVYIQYIDLRGTVSRYSSKETIERCIHPRAH